MSEVLILHRGDGTSPATAFVRKGFGADDPLAWCRDIAWEGPDAMAAGRVNYLGECAVDHYPHTETLVVVEGELVLHSPGQPPLHLRAGSGAVIGSGCSVRIVAAARVRWVFCAAVTTGPAKPGLIALRADANFKPSNGPAPELLLGPSPQCRSDNVYTDEPTLYRAGTWDSTAYLRVVRAHPLNEFMHLLAGRVRFASPDGPALEAAAGDALFVPQGAAIGWESQQHVAKFYVVQTAKR